MPFEPEFSYDEGINPNVAQTPATGPNDLTTVADVQAWLSLSSNQDGALLQRLVSAASAFIQTCLGYNVAETSYTETRSGNGRGLLFLRHSPIVSIESLTVGALTWSPSSGYGQTGYGFDTDTVFLTNGAFERGLRNVTITYTAGYAAPPPDLAQACIELVALKYRMRDKINLVSEGMMQQTTSYVQKDMPASVMTTIQKYRSVFQ